MVATPSIMVLPIRRRTSVIVISDFALLKLINHTYLIGLVTEVLGQRGARTKAFII
ncbi:MAG: hypothetical protein ACFFDN_00715 [Candidatus Hodarchaeota archaeon]